MDFENWTSTIDSLHARRGGVAPPKLDFPFKCFVLKRVRAGGNFLKLGNYLLKQLVGTLKMIPEDSSRVCFNGTCELLLLIFKLNSLLSIHNSMEAGLGCKCPLFVRSRLSRFRESSPVLWSKEKEVHVRLSYLAQANFSAGFALRREFFESNGYVA